MALDDIGIAHSVHDPGRRFFLQLHLALAFPDRTFSIVIDAILSEQLLQLRRFLVTKVKEAVARMMGVQAQFGAIRADRTFRSHHESLAATAAKLIFTLAAREMHATYKNSRALFFFSARASENVPVICISNNLEKISRPIF